MPVSWTALGQVTVGPSDLSVVVGSFDLDEGDDTIWVDVAQINPDDFWPWSYGILSWQTDRGKNLAAPRPTRRKEDKFTALELDALHVCGQGCSYMSQGHSTCRGLRRETPLR